MFILCGRATAGPDNDHCRATIPILSPICVTVELHKLNVLSAGALWSPAFGIGHLLSFSQLFEADTLNGRRMEEQVFVLSRVDESEALVQQLFDRAFRHWYVSLDG